MQVEECFPLHQAASRGDCEVVSHLLAEGADLEARDRGTFTPLHIAASFGRAAVADILLAAGANTSATTLNGSPATPLHLAVGNGNSECARALIEGGADPTPSVLLHAAKRGRFGLCAWLLDVGADPNDQEGDDALQCLILAKPGDTKTAEHLPPTVRAFLQHGYDLTATGKSGATALHAAAQVGAVDICQMLLEGRAELDAKHEVRCGITPLHLASEFGRVRAVQLLLDFDANPWIEDGQGQTPLDLAREGAVRKLLLAQPGASVHAVKSEPAMPTCELSDEEDGDLFVTPSPRGKSGRPRIRQALARRFRGAQCMVST